MNVASGLTGCSLAELQALPDGGTLTVNSLARLPTADRPVDRSGILVTFTFASLQPSAQRCSELRRRYSQPSLSRLTAGARPVWPAPEGRIPPLSRPSSPPSRRKVKFTEVTFTQITGFSFAADGGRPERPDNPIQGSASRWR